MTTKLCKRCGTVKSIDLFSRDKNRKDGHDCMCKECTKARYRAARVRVICEGCGKELLKLPHKKSRLCSLCGTRKSNMTRTGRANGNWKGGASVSVKGYRYIRKKNHPRAGKTGYVAEHLLVMENMIGRPVAKHETVHHKNGRKRDNTPNNLELWAAPHPAGQRVEDLVDWVLANYREDVLRKLKETQTPRVG